MFTSKFASRILIVATVALWLGIAGSAHASEPFLAAFVEAMESGQLKHESAGPTQYQDPTAGGTIIQTEMVSLSLTSVGPVTVVPGSGDFAVDSFFDVSYEIDSFFDVFTELSLRVTPGTHTATTGTFQTEILSMDLSGLTGPVRIDPTIDPIRMSTGHVTVLKREDGEFHIDSFFDVFTELSLDNGTTWMPSAGSTPLMASYDTPEPSTWALLVCAGMTLAVLRVRRTKVG